MITAAAIRKDGINYSLPRPARHKDIIRNMILELELDIEGNEEYGFLTDKGVFYSRSESAQHGYLFNQIKDWNYDQELKTEDLW